MTKRARYDGPYEEVRIAVANQGDVPLPKQWLVRIIVDQEATGYVFNP